MYHLYCTDATKKITSSASYIPNEPLHERVRSTDSVLQFIVCVKYKIAKYVSC